MHHHQPKNISRRKLLQLSLLAAGGLLTSGLTGCKSKNKKQVVANKKKLEKKVWDKNTLYVNTKTKTIHYPDVYRASEKLDSKHFTKAPISDWEKLLDQDKAHFLKERSGIIFETLALKNLAGEVSDNSLNKSTEILQRSFTDIYCKSNRYSWRTYDLLLQFIALNNLISPETKWQRFSESVKCAEAERLKMPKRNMWVRNEEGFNLRIKYISDKRTEYLERINKRINGRV